MPELPEVETMRRGILSIVGSTICGVVKVKCSCRPIRLEPTALTFQRRANGRKVVTVDRLGKRVAVGLDNGDAIVFEPRMTGLVLVADPPDNDYLRFRLDLENGTTPHVWYWDRRGLGSVRLLSKVQLNQQFGPETLGPDALQVGAEQLHHRMGKSRREIKVALLDQKAIAGIGNLYASEILHVAGIYPRRRSNRLTAAEWVRLSDAIHAVLEDAIRNEGSTLSDGTYRNALNQSGGYQALHRVYDRAGKVCLTCQRGNIERIVQAQRSTFFCPSCQTKHRRSP